MSQPDPIIAGTMRGAWPSLPALLVASAGVCAAATVPILIAPGLTPVTVVLYAVLAAPFLAALAAVGNAAAFGDPATIRTWATALRAHCAFAIRHALVPALAGVLFLASLRLWARDHPLWMFPSLALTGAATVLALLGLLAILPLGVARPALRGTILWITALHLVARRPTRFIAVLCLAGLGIWTATAWTASILLLVPAPATLVTVAAVWTTVTESEPGTSSRCRPSP